MRSLSVFVLFIFLIALIKCVHSAHVKLENVVYGRRLEGFSFVSYYGRGIHDCVDKCGRRVQCRSLNYHKGVKMCELNTRGAAAEPEVPLEEMLQSQEGFIYIEYVEWGTRVGLLPFVHIVSCLFVYQ